MAAVGDAADDPLVSAGRVAAVTATGLTGEPDAALDRLAELARSVVGTPMALVSLVGPDRETLPGAAGLTGSGQDRRELPWSRSFGRYVVADAAPVVVVDARHDDRVADNAAIADLGVAAYLGVPLTDEDGWVLGALAVIGHGPRRWTDTDIERLVGLGAACSAELRCRIAGARLRAALIAADDSARRQRAAETRTAELAAEVEQSLANSQLLLAASEALTSTSTVAEVLAVVSGLVSSAIRPANVHIAVLGPDGRLAVRGLDGLDGLDTGVVRQWSTMDITAASPSATAARTQRPVFVGTPARIAEQFPAIVAAVDRLGWRAVASAPLGTSELVGALTLAWDREHTFDLAERSVIVALAGYVGHAIGRATRLAQRTAAAETLQRALLTSMPVVPGYQLAARYQPAQRGDQIGGDWYDAFAVDGGRLAVAIGDVSGHNIRAAARMGQLRSMLRAFALLPGAGPADVLSQLDDANRRLGDDTIATAVLVVVGPAEDASWPVVWSNAGHLPPIVVGSDGRVTAPADHDGLLGLRERPSRTDHQLRLRPGDTLLLITDGLVEVRDRALDHRLNDLYRQLAAFAGADLDHLLDTVLARIAPPDHDDDIAVIAVRPSSVAR